MGAEITLVSYSRSDLRSAAASNRLNGGSPHPTGLRPATLPSTVRNGQLGGLEKDIIIMISLASNMEAANAGFEMG